MRLLTIVGIAAIVVAFAMPAFAETQNVKISGDIAVAHFHLQNGDLASKSSAVGADANENDNEDFFMQTTGLNLEADLTDNVSTYVRIINERAYDVETNGATDLEIALDEAYVTLEEMLYAPLTVKIGRQNIVYGKGFIIGNPGSTVWDANGNIPNVANELSDLDAFDAIRATLDYDPWTIDLLYSKIDDNGANDLVNDDIDLYAVNIGYKFTKYDAEAEAYFVSKNDKSLRTSAIATEGDTNDIETVGLRGSFVPFDNMNVWAEGAWQFGHYASAVDQSEYEADREATAFDIGGIYTFTDVRWTPKLGLEYIFYSGEDVNADGSVSSNWNAWDPVYRGKFDTYLAEYRNITKVTDYDTAQGVAANLNNSGATNEQQIAIIGSLDPMADVAIDARATLLTFDNVPISGRSDDLGWELDAKATYDYTEDVQFAVAVGMYVPGEYYPNDNDETASQVVSSVKVDF